MKIGTRWIERLMPPVVTGAVVMAIGLNLAPIAVRSVSASAFDGWMAVLTVLCIGLVAVFTRGMIQRLLILVGLIVACGCTRCWRTASGWESAGFYLTAPGGVVRAAALYRPDL
jgi:xanthine/uracil permease